MIFQGRFTDITNTYVYFVKFGKNGITREIQDGDNDVYNDGKILCFANESPVTIECNMSNTFEHVYIRSCTVNLVSNFDIREYVVAANVSDIPIEVRQTTVANASQTLPSTWSIVFKGFINPLSFNQPFALNWNEFSLECTDLLGQLEYIQFPQLLVNQDYNTPRYFLNLALSQCGFTSINFSIIDDYTETTKINPIIFVGDDPDNQDDWMSALEAVEEICKIYGCYIWQDSDICNVENILRLDLTNPQLVTNDDYTANDANISVDTAYNSIKFEVDISNADSDFIDPFNEDMMTPTTEPVWGERIMTEILVKDDDMEHFATFMGLCRQTSFQTYNQYMARNWQEYAQNTAMKNDVEIYDHYCKILESNLLDFGERSYLTEGGGSGTTNVYNTLQWLKNNPGKGALLALCSTENVVDQKNISAISMNDPTNMLVIQVGGHTVDTAAECQRLETQLTNNMPVCSFTLDSSNNFTPTDVSTTNYLVISCKFKLNPVIRKTGIRYSDDYSTYECSTNTIQECLDRWRSLGDIIISPWYSTDGCLYKVGITDVEDDDKFTYYQNYNWTNGINPDYQTLYDYPYKQSANIDNPAMFQPDLKAKWKWFKWEGSYYIKKDASEIDDMTRIPILACELSVGTGAGKKYLCENPDQVKAWAGTVPTKRALTDMYSWHTSAEAESLGINPWFTLPADPTIGKWIIGEELNVQNTCDVSLGIKEKGFAIPISYNDMLNGPVQFRILGPVNTSWDEVGYSRKHFLFWSWNWKTTHTYHPLLAYVENIFVKDITFTIASDNAGKAVKNNENDLVYFSSTNPLYADDESVDCKFCTSLTGNQVNELGVDYTINNSAILKMDYTPWYGMNNYGGQSYTGDDNLLKLEEARVAEQYAIWNRPRNIIEMSLVLDDPEKCNYKNNFRFNYVDGIYKTIAREMDLKFNTMTCTMKDFSDN